MYLTPERRHRTRFLTLKNAAIVGLALGVAFILLSVWSGLRPAHSDASRNLLEPRVSADSSSEPRAARAPVAIVLEGSAADRPGADSLLVDAGTTQVAPVPASVPMPVAAPPKPPAPQKSFDPLESQLGKGSRITISDGSAGVQLHVETVRQPATSTSERPVTAPAAQPPQSP
jgi:hypothetical protein